MIPAPPLNAESALLIRHIPCAFLESPRSRSQVKRSAVPPQSGPTIIGGTLLRLSHPANPKQPPPGLI
jgi:hypothetical protein